MDDVTSQPELLAIFLELFHLASKESFSSNVIVRHQSSETESGVHSTQLHRIRYTGFKLFQRFRRIQLFRAEIDKPSVNLPELFIPALISPTSIGVSTVSSWLGIGPGRALQPVRNRLIP